MGNLGDEIKRRTVQPATIPVPERKEPAQQPAEPQREPEKEPVHK